MKNNRKHAGGTMRKYYQLTLIIVCIVSIVTLLIYRHEYYRLRYVLEMLNFFGKPGLSEVEFCGPGFNATMLSEIVRNSSMEVRDTPPLFQQIDENFYTYSSFLKSYKKYEKLTQTYAHNIDTIVIGKTTVNPNFRCNVYLENSSKPKPGRFTFKEIGKPINGYNLYIFHCTLSQDMGKPVGISFYLNDYNVNPFHAPITRVIQVETKRKPRQRNRIKFINNLEPALCVIPNQVPLVSRNSFIEFLIFHHMMGVNYFTIYDSMISEDIIRRLNLIPTDITRWDIQFFPLNYPFIFSKSYEIVRKAIELDCLYRHFRVDKEDANKASHAIVLSWDEFLVPRIHTNIRAVLDDFDPARKLQTIEIKPLVFCLNQPDDENSEAGHPDIMRKTHYYNVPQEKQNGLVRNLDLMTSFKDISTETNKKTISLELLGIHKYTECRDPNYKNGLGYNETQMQVFQHKFEGAMMKFDSTLMSNTVYRLYRTGQIWEKTGSDEHVRDML